jgi:hypothetical protein
LFFEYQNIKALKDYFASEYAEAFSKYFGVDQISSNETPEENILVQENPAALDDFDNTLMKDAIDEIKEEVSDVAQSGSSMNDCKDTDIAIIGMAGYINIGFGYSVVVVVFFAGDKACKG